MEKSFNSDKRFVKVKLVERNLLENVSVTHGAKYNYRAISYAWLLPAYFGAINHGSNREGQHKKCWQS